MRHAWIALLVSSSLAGCFSPDYGNGELQCAVGGVCPSGLHCAADNRCYRAGSDPDLSAASDMDDSADLGPSGDDGGHAPKHQGQACGPADTCDTGNCVDGYCCDSPCANTCQACNVAGNLGICTNVGAGVAPVGARSCNPQAKSTCGRDGTCDGAGNCRDWPSGTQCAGGTCDAATGNFTNPSTCNGAGTCVPNPGGNCAPYVCQDSTQCFSSCTGPSQCSGTNSCVNSSCGPLPTGRTCTGDAQCASTHCVDGYCCNSACNAAACQACDVPGSLGNCSTVGAGAPHGSRTCTHQGMSPCGGSCNGMSASCAYGSATTPCGATCTGGRLQKSFCDGSGTCTAATPATCTGNYACPTGGSACLTSCGLSSDCYPTATYGCNSSMQCKNYCVLDTDTLNDGCILK